MSRGNGPPRSQIFKKSTSRTISPAVTSRVKQSRAVAGDREAPGAWDLTSARAWEVEVAATWVRGAGRHPAVRSASALSAAAGSPPARALSPRSASLDRCASDSPSL